MCAVDEFEYQRRPCTALRDGVSWYVVPALTEKRIGYPTQQLRGTIGLSKCVAEAGALFHQAHGDVIDDNQLMRIAQSNQPRRHLGHRPARHTTRGCTEGQLQHSMNQAVQPSG